MSTPPYEAMRKGGAVRNPVFHAVEASRIRTQEEALCGAKSKVHWVYCAPGAPENITCGRCRVKLLSLSSDQRPEIPSNVGDK